MPVGGGTGTGTGDGEGNEGNDGSGSGDGEGNDGTGDDGGSGNAGGGDGGASGTPRPSLPPPTASPTPPPAPGGDGTGRSGDDGGPACFPASARVLLADGSTVAVGELRTGAAVASTPGSPATAVYGWTHKAAEGAHQFVRLSMGNAPSAFAAAAAATPPHTLTLSPDHYVVANGRLVAASAIVVGDRLVNATGGGVDVTAVARVTATGLYHPHTTSGVLVVDGVLVSDLTAALPPAVSRSLLAAIQRLGVRGGGGGGVGLGGTLLAALEGGVSARLAALLPRGPPASPLV